VKIASPSVALVYMTSYYTGSMTMLTRIPTTLGA
jgi:hypothetical protein